MMKKLIAFIFALCYALPAVAQTSDNEFHYVLDVVQQMKLIVLGGKDEQASRKALATIKNAQPLVNNDNYQGHQVIVGREIHGLIGVQYQSNKATVAAFVTPPLRVRHATTRYKTFRKLLAQHYQETKHNYFDLGDQVIARIKKETRKVSIDVYRKK